MKSYAYKRRFYRDWIDDRTLHTLRIQVKETDIEIRTDRPVDKEAVQEEVRRLRWGIERYLQADARFLTALKPLPVAADARPIVKEMARAAEKAGVGPMAAVAGAVAQYLGRYLLRRGCHEVIIENGGDIFLKTRKARFIGIYAGRGNKWNNLRLKVEPAGAAFGICTSSGTVGHSLSFGRAEAVVITARNAALADAVATATANRVRTKRDMPQALEFARTVPGIRGVLIIYKDTLLVQGNIELSS